MVARSHFGLMERTTINCESNLSVSIFWHSVLKPPKLQIDWYGILTWIFYNITLFLSKRSLGSRCATCTFIAIDISRAIACGNNPNIYPMLSHFFKWIWPDLSTIFWMTSLSTADRCLMNSVAIFIDEATVEMNILEDTKWSKAYERTSEKIGSSLQKWRTAIKTFRVHFTIPMWPPFSCTGADVEARSCSRNFSNNISKVNVWWPATSAWTLAISRQIIGYDKSEEY